MKKIILTAALFLGIGMTQVNAQNLSFGVKADANLSNFILSDMDGVKSNMKVGASLGGFMKYDITSNFAIQPELLFHFKSSDMETAGVKSNYEYWGAEIPVYAVGQWNAGSGRFYAGVGPYIGMGFSAKNTNGDIDLYKKTGTDDKAAMQRWDFGAGAMVGYEFACGVQINAGYKLGFINGLDRGKDDAKMLPQAVSLGVGFRF